MAYHTHSIIRLGDGHTLHQIDGYQLSREEKTYNLKQAVSAELAVGILEIDQEDCYIDHDSILYQMEFDTEAIACGMRDGSNYGRHYSMGDRITQWWIYPPELTDFQIEKDLEAQGFRTYREQCTHAYDCCARWYSDGVWIRRTETRALATISISRNV